MGEHRCGGLPRSTDWPRCAPLRCLIWLEAPLWLEAPPLARSALWQEAPFGKKRPLARSALWQEAPFGKKRPLARSALHQKVFSGQRAAFEWEP